MAHEPNLCNDCGAEIPMDAPQGICPRCMLGVGLATVAEPSDTADATEPITVETSTPTSALLTPGQRFGNYELVEVIGRGGMGVVYKARQLTLGRSVALKMLSAGTLASEQELKRFQSEAEAAAGLSHPNVVSVYEVGEVEGRQFFSMQYVEGLNLSEKMRNQRIGFRDTARYMKQVAEAVDHAHDNDVLHRDLKPSNVIIDSSDQVHVTDFGLAKRISDTSDITLSGQIIGTPSYMSPEQAAGERKRITQSTDIYSIGAVLYHMLTGHPPFHGDNSMHTLQLVREADPVLPREYNPTVPRELEMICLKCLEKGDKRRYPTVRALAEDLGRFLNGESIRFGRIKMFDRLVRTLERGHYDEEMLAWGTMCLWFAIIIAAAHTAVFAQIRIGPPYDHVPWLIAGRICEFFAIGVVMWVNRRDWFPIESVAARQLWVLWMAYLAGSMVLAHVSWLAWPRGPEADPYNVLTLYPQLAVLSGMGFFVMGSSYWGGCHAFGAILFGLAVAMPTLGTWAPLVFGLVWCLGLASMGKRLRLLAREYDHPSDA